MKLKLPPARGLTQEEFNRRVLEALAAVKRAVDDIEDRLAAAGIP